MGKPFGKPSKEDMFEFKAPTDEELGLVPAGNDQIGKLVNLEKGTSSKNNPMWVWDFVIVQGPHQGKDFRMWTALTPNAMWKLVETLQALGIRFEPGEKVNFGKQDVLGTLVRLVLVEDNYEGRKQTKLSGILPHPDGAGKKGKGTSSFAPDDEEDEVEDEEDYEDEETDEEETDDEEVEDDEEDTDEDEEDEEEDEPVRPVKKTAAAPAKKAAPAKSKVKAKSRL